MTDVEYLAKELAGDRTWGNSTFELDWGNCIIVCEDSTTKNILRKLAEEYLELKNEKRLILQAMHIEEKDA